MSSPRIISGSAKGFHLKSVPGEITRPITDRVKEALFNIIGADIQDTKFLDLFAGTGSVGIEALSRGASSVTFIENNRIAYQILLKNIEFCKVSDRAHVIFGDAFDFLNRPPKRSFEYIFIAPPQYKELWERALLLLDKQRELLSDDGWIIVQINPIEWKETQLQNLELFDSRTYGSTLLIFFQKKIT